ncbi:hypothetical protein RIF29_40877 [Crotalaria pallida]|uniref:Ribosomal protein L37a n=1 Tax=Crotalaria pallida TaxID=3830 RepID=A0AAN9E4H7_CROPI
MEVSQHSKFFCEFCGKYAVKRKAVGIWGCKDCGKVKVLSKRQKERVSDPAAKPSHFAARSNVPPYGPLPMIAMDNDNGISYTAIRGPTGELLEKNGHILGGHI